jgi:molybdopterin/thiamine biosynthesis adenylyltransferase/rhodanese-related sulfurtransferase
MMNWHCCRHLPADNKIMTHSKRYDRQIALAEIGISGQQKLADAKVLVVGAGGLGCPVLQSLAAVGVGRIGIADGDVVEETNLHRQFLYTKEDCGKNKAIVAAAAVLKQNPDVNVISYTTHFAKANAFAIAGDYHIIVDCTDNPEARYLINDVSLVKEIPMVYASIHKFEGQLSVLNYKGGPSYRCLFPEKETITDTCADLGVLGILPNMIGVLQANEVLKITLGIGKILNGKILIYNGLDLETKMIAFDRNETEIANGFQKGMAILKDDLVQVKTIYAADFIQAAETTDALILDIREIYEEPKLPFIHIVSVPVLQLEDYLRTTDKNRKIILFCQHGQNSLMAAKFLTNAGFTNVCHLENGIEALPTNIFQHDYR